MQELELVMISEVYITLSLPDMISVGIWSECMDGQSASGSISLCQNHGVSSNEKGLIRTQTGKMHQVLYYLT